VQNVINCVALLALVVLQSIKSPEYRDANMLNVTLYVQLAALFLPSRWFRAVMGKLFKEGAKGKEKNFRRANIIY